MKIIVVPTDFSDVARCALHSAAQLANHFGARIHLVHFYQVHSRAGMLMSIRNFMQRAAEENLAVEVAAVRTDLKERTSLVTRALEAGVIDGIVAYAGALHADLIVMGTQGANRFPDIFLGTMATATIRRSSLPVLVVPPQWTYRPPTRLGLAVDDQVLFDTDRLAPLLALAAAYQGQVELLHVDAPGRPAAVLDPAYEIVLGQYLHRTHRLAEADLHRGLQQMVEEPGIDLLVMIRRQRSFLERLFQGSRTLREVFSSSVPLLILPEA
ncbi:MAG: universal stress protein [Bacteroidota bacterium]